MRRSVSELKAGLSRLADRLHHLSPISAGEHRAVCGLWREVRELSARQPLPDDGPWGFIVSGWACQQRVMASGRRQIILFLTEGDSFGPCADEAAQPTQEVCLTHVQVVDARSVLEGAVVEEFPALARVFAAAERRRQAFMVDHLVRLAARDGRGGLAHLILELEARTAPAGCVHEDWFPLPVGQRTLGHAMGFSTVHVNHTLARLRAEGLLEIEAGRARILDRERMSSLAEGRPLQPSTV